MRGDPLVSDSAVPVLLHLPGVTGGSGSTGTPTSCLVWRVRAFWKLGLSVKGSQRTLGALVAGSAFEYGWGKTAWPTHGENFVKTHKQNYFESRVRRSGKNWFLLFAYYSPETQKFVHIFLPSPHLLAAISSILQRSSKEEVWPKGMHKTQISFPVKCSGSPGIYKDLDNKCVSSFPVIIVKARIPASVESFSVFSEGSFVSWE